MTLFVLLRILLAGASRYAGAPDGPAFRPREPLCEQCGYAIVGLPLTSVCPECGLPVADSLPGGRRQDTDWQRHERSFLGLLELIRLQGHILRDPDFFKRLPVQQGLSSARHFWWGTFMLMVVFVLAITRILLTNDFGPSGGLALLAAAIMVVPILGQLLTMFVACLWAQIRLEIRDYRVAAAACYYASPLMWPAAILLTIAILLSGGLAGATWHRHVLSVLKFRLTFGELFAASVGVVLLVCLAFWWFRLAAALRDVRYANV